MQKAVALLRRGIHADGITEKVLTSPTDGAALSGSSRHVAILSPLLVGLHSKEGYIVVVEHIVATANAARKGFEITHCEIAIAIAAPPPVDMEIIGSIVAIHHEAMASSERRALIQDRTLFVQLGFEQ